MEDCRYALFVAILNSENLLHQKTCEKILMTLASLFRDRAILEAFQSATYRKSSIKPTGGCFNFGPSRGGLIERGLIREGGPFTKLCDNDIFRSFSVLLSHILQNQHTILWLQYINSIQFLSQTIPELTCKVV